MTRFKLILLVLVGLCTSLDAVEPPVEIPGAVSYETAYAACLAERQPMVIYIGAPWCVPCVRTRWEHLLPMAQDGVFRECAFVELEFPVDQPQTPEQGYAAQIAARTDGRIPQLVIVSRYRGVWKQEVWRAPLPRNVAVTMIKRAVARMRGQ